MASCLRTSALSTFALVAAVFFTTWTAAAEPPPEKDWEIRFTPLIEFSNIDGSLTADNFTVDIGAGFSDIFQRLNFAAFGQAEARWHRLVASVDVIYANLGDKGDIGPGGSTRLDWNLEQLIVDAKFGYRVLSRHVGPGPAEAGSARGRLDIDLMAGLRYWQIDSELDVTPPGPFQLDFDANPDWVEPVVGARLGWRPFERWWFGLRGDIGGFDAGDAELTWRAAGLGSFALSRRWDLVAGYRALGINDDRGRAQLDYVMHGPVLGVSLHF